jgi:hypothetical protein
MGTCFHPKLIGLQEMRKLGFTKPGGAAGFNPHVVRDCGK